MRPNTTVLFAPLRLSSRLIGSSYAAALLLFRLYLARLKATLTRSFVAMLGRVGVLLLFAVVWVMPASFAQNELIDTHDYHALTPKGRIPADILKALQGNQYIAAANGKSPTDRVMITHLSILTAVHLRDVFVGNYVYYNDSMTAYVRRVATRIITANKLETVGEVRFFVTRFSSPNAITWQDGTILINVGLLRATRNEAELAFIIAHELAHFVKHHPLERYSHTYTEDGERTATAADVAKLNIYLKEYESVADKQGFGWLKKAGYSTAAAAAILERICNTPEPTTTNLANALSTPSRRLENSEFGTDTERKAYLKAKQTELIGSLNTRIVELRKLHASTLLPDTVKYAQIDTVVFGRVQTMATYEVIANRVLQAEYILAAYSALVEYQKLHTRFAYSQAVEALYYVGYYKRIKKLHQKTFGEEEVRQDEVAKFYAFVNRLSDKDLGDIIANFIEQGAIRYPDDEIIALYRARQTESHESTEKAKPLYEAYCQKFPHGIAFEFAHLKITK